jgi:acetate kinase
MKILVANVGSTSLKYKLFEITDESVLAEGRIERIGDRESPFEHRGRGETTRGSASLPDYPSAVQKGIELLTHLEYGAIHRLDEVAAVGFKTVHLRGEPGAYVLTDDVLQRMEDYNDLVPAHNPPYINAIRIFRDLLPGIPLVGLFEPAFHTTMPAYVTIYGVPYRWYETYGVRKYGFHGASHRYIAETVPRILRRPAEGLRIVSCHLGGSSSVCAIKDGRSLDTSMGFSAQSGLFHSTRCGSIDPFIIPFIMDREGLTTGEIRRILCKESGWLGVSGVSGDVRDVLEAADRGDERAALAIEAFCYQVKTTIGAYAAGMGGLDAVAFAGGIGERGVRIREKVCEGLEFLGVKVDPERNRSVAGEGWISAEGASVAVLVVRTNEEIIVARETARVIRA